MPGNLLAPSLAESWTVSPDQRVYEFKLREGLKFHNGDPFTAEDVKFSFQRAKGAKILQDKVREVEIVGPVPGALPSARAVARLHDLLRHVRDRRGLDRAEEVHGAGRRRRLQEAPGRPRALQVREPHAGHRAGDGGLRGLLAQDAVGEAPRLQERPGGDHAAGDAQARRGRPRLPARRARRPRRSSAIPSSSSRSRAASARSTSTSSTSGIRNRRGTTSACAWPRASRSTARRSARPRRSAPRADRQHGPAQASSSRCRSSRIPTIRRRRSSCWPRRAIPTASTAAISIRGRPTPRRARRSSATSARSASRRACARWSAPRSTPRWRPRSSTGLCMCVNAVYGNAASRLSETVPSDGAFAYGALSRHRRALQAAEPRDRSPRSARRCSTRSSSSLHERVRFAPIYDYIWPSGIGPRVDEPALMLIDPYPWSAPLEDVRLKK